LLPFNNPFLIFQTSSINFGEVFYLPFAQKNK